jgi:hypothetical protein
MKKLLFTAALVLFLTNTTTAQTSEGTILIGTNIGNAMVGGTNIGFTSVDGESTLSIGADAGYFIMDDLALKVGLGYSSNSLADSNTFAYRLGAKYYLMGKLPLTLDFTGASVKDAEENAGKDEEKKSLVEAKNKSESLIYSTEKSLKEHSEKIPSSDKEGVESVIKDLKSALELENINEINSHFETLTQASAKIGQQFHGHDQQQSDVQDNAKEKKSSSNSDEKVVDAEYEEVNDKKD